MKVHKVELMIIDYDDMDSDDITEVIENAHYPNRCIYPDVMNIETKDIGEWSDDHPLNKRHTRKDEYNRIFRKLEKGMTIREVLETHE